MLANAFMQDHDRLRAHTFLTEAAKAGASQQCQHQPTAIATATATASWSSAPCGVHVCAGNPVPFSKVPGQVPLAVNSVKATLEQGDLSALLSTDGGREELNAEPGWRQPDPSKTPHAKTSNDVSAVGHGPQVLPKF